MNNGIIGGAVGQGGGDTGYSIGVQTAMGDMGPIITLPSGQVWLRGGDYVPASQATQLAKYGTYRNFAEAITVPSSGSVGLGSQPAAHNGTGTVIALDNAGSIVQVRRSTDYGVTWTAVTSPSGLSGITALGALTFGNNLFVAVGQVSGSASLVLARSSDGINWIQGSSYSTSPFGATSYITRGVGVWTGSRYAFYCEGTSNSYAVITSTDGSTVASHASIGASSSYNSTQQQLRMNTDGAGNLVIWYPHGFSSPQGVMRSTDHGVTWGGTTSITQTRGMALNSQGVWVQSGSGSTGITYHSSVDATTGTVIAGRFQCILCDRQGGTAYAVTARGVVFELTPSGLLPNAIGHFPTASSAVQGEPGMVSIPGIGYIGPTNSASTFRMAYPFKSVAGGIGMQPIDDGSIATYYVRIK